MKTKHYQGIKIVSQGLGELLDEVVFVGGAVAELYVYGSGAEEARISDDIDCVIEITSRKEFRDLERKLEEKGFQHDTSPGAPICRWIYDQILVDIMPTKAEILGFTNKWYLAGIEHRITHKLSEEITIQIFPLAFYLASKLDALSSRGGRDLRQSTDFEDIIFILDNNPDILESLKSSPDEVKTYLKEQFRELLNRADILEGIECALPTSADSDSVERILHLLQFE